MRITQEEIHTAERGLFCLLQSKRQIKVREFCSEEMQWAD